MGPLIALHLFRIGRFDRVHLTWLVGSQLITWGGYLATRSRHGTGSLRFQIGVLVCIIASACWFLPDSVPAMMALLLPVLSSGICLRLRDVLVTQVLVLLFVVVKSTVVGGLPSDGRWGPGGVLLGLRIERCVGLAAEA